MEQDWQGEEEGRSRVQRRLDVNARQKLELRRGKDGTASAVCTATEPLNHHWRPLKNR